MHDPMPGPTGDAAPRWDGVVDAASLHARLHAPELRILDCRHDLRGPNWACSNITTATFRARSLRIWTATCPAARQAAMAATRCRDATRWPRAARPGA